MKHTLKCDPKPFAAVISGRKKFEIRRDDRGFNVGDILQLKETRHSAAEMLATASACPLEYTGRTAQLRVDHILSGHAGLAEGFVVMSVTVQLIDENTNTTPQ